MGYGADISGGMIATGSTGAYNINRSLRFRSSASAYLNRTFGTATNNKKWTWSGWVKRGILDSGTNIYGLLSAYAGVSNTYGYIDFYQDGIRITDYTIGTQNITFQTTQVFRDPSAWYHILIAVDTTQSTSTNRLFMYVNGVQVTSFSSAVYPILNSNTTINSAIATYLGNDPSNSPGYFDGYLAEVNFIDGQALTPFAFGNFNPTTGVWGANKYIGTYGTNGFYLNFTDNSGLTLLSNTGIGRDFSGNGNYWATNNISLATATTITSFTSTGTTSWTAPAGVTSVNYLVVAGGGAGGNHNGGGGGGGGVLQGNVPVVPGQSYTVTVGAGGSAQSDPSNGGNGSNSQFGNNIIALGGGGGAGQLTANGVPNGNSGGSGGGGSGGENSIVVGSSGGAGTTGQGFAGGGPGLEVAGANTQRAGGGGGGAGQAGVGPVNAYSGGAGGNGVVSYMSGTGAYYGGGGGGGSQWDQGQAVVGAGGLGGGGSGAAVSNASTSVTVAASTAGTTNTGGGGGAQGRSANSSASAGGSGIVILQYTTSGSSPTYDSMTDVPTLTSGTNSNYCTLNPINNTGFTIANGNLGITGQSNASGVTGTVGASSGRYYWEITWLTGTEKFFGIVTSAVPNQTYLTTVNGVTSVLIGQPAGSQINIYTGVTGGSFTAVQSNLSAFNNNDVIGIALDLTLFTIQFYRNGVAIGTAVSLTPGIVWLPWISSGNNTFNNFTATVNFGQQPFVYSPPSGFDTLNTYNLPSPTIPAGNVAVNAITYTGGSSTPPGLGQLPKRTAATLSPVNSLRLRSGNSAYLNRTPFTASNTNTWTFSAWVKRGLISNSTSYALLTAGYPSAPWLYVGFQNDNMYLSYTAGVNNTGQVLSNSVLRDASQWYHLVLAIDTTQAVASNRVQFYVNGQQVTSFLQATYPSQYQSLFVNTQVGHQIGGYTGQYYDGYMAEANFVDGQQLLPSAFGTTNTDGQWVPIPYIGTYGTNGYRLPFTGNTTPSFAGSFNGTSQWVSTGTASSRFNLAQSDWTVEGWYYSTSTVSNSARYMVFTPGQALGADTSAYNNTVTVSGTPTWNQLSPYGTSTQGGSLYFNGTNTSLQTASSTGNFLFGNGNFTVEAWIYPQNITAYQYIASVWGVVGGPGDNAQSCWQIRINTSGNFEAVLNNGATTTAITGSTVLTLRQWQHVALVRSGNTVSLFVNGVNVNTTTYTSTLNNVPTTQFVIGQQLPSSYYFNGYITNLRIVNGTALYTTTWFTPPTAALPIANSTQTVLLMDVASAGSYITDSSSYAQTFTVNGTLVYSPASPYSPVALGGSAYLTGSSQYFSAASNSTYAPGTGDFTIEAWVYPTSLASWIPIFQNDQVGTSTSDKFYFAWNNSNSTLGIGQHSTSNVAYASWTPIANTWYHLAAVRQAGTIKIFINGVQQTVTNSTLFASTSFGQNGAAVGGMSSPYYLTGYITNLRYIVGLAQYGQSFTPVTTQALSAVPGTVLLMNMTSSGNTYGIIPYTSTDFTLNLFGQSVNTATISGAMKLNVWQHIALVRSGQTTTLYVDGVASAATVYPWWTNGTVTVFFGGVSGTYVNYFQGNISNFRIVMGTAVYTTNFTPQTAPLRAIIGTALLTMNSSTVTDSAGVTNLTNNNVVSMATATPFQANISMDASGNFNNWFVNNVGMISNSVTYDVMTDVPADASSTSANWLTMNPSFGSTGSLTNANLTFAGTSSGNTQRIATMGLSAGKWYFEMTMATNVSSTADFMVGISNTASNMITTYTGQKSDSYAAYSSGGNTSLIKLNNNIFYSTDATQVASGDVIGIAFDLDNLRFWIAKNGVWVDSGNPSAGTNPGFTLVSGTYVPSCRASGGTGNSSGNLNFGQQPYAYAPPTGFNALNTYNNPVTATWWGNGNSYPDLTWIKSRSAATSHMLMDTVRGPSLYLSTDQTNPQYGSGGAYNWSKYGLVLANDGNTNVAGNTYVLWGWTAGQGNAVVNTSGSISSTVSANPTAGFSIVSFNQSSAANYSIGHGLGVTPNFWIFKVLNGSYYWVGHSSLAYNQYLQVNSTAAAVTDSTVWNAPATSSVINVGSTWTSNSPNQVIAYCWTAVPGYSAFGSYTGNGSTDGPFIYLGFRPRWILYKSTTETSYWNVFDTARSTYNVDGPYLNPNVNSAEASTTLIDILSNGFKLRTSSSGNNTSSATYIYAAFAENPFKYALAR
jgi:hypothetical protein